MAKKRQTKQLVDKQALSRGAEPYWMQDIRLAQRRIEAERARLRAAQAPPPSE